MINEKYIKMHPSLKIISCWYTRAFALLRLLFRFVVFWNEVRVCVCVCVIGRDCSGTRYAPWVLILLRFSLFCSLRFHFYFICSVNEMERRSTLSIWNWTCYLCNEHTPTPIHREHTHTNWIFNICARCDSHIIGNSGVHTPHIGPDRDSISMFYAVP